MKSASVGLTLTTASRVVLMEPGLNLATERQAIGRIHRFGQQRPVHVVRLLLCGTVDEKIVAMHDSHQAAPSSSTDENETDVDDEDDLDDLEAGPSAAAPVAAGTQAQASLGVDDIKRLLL